ncbi:HupE/UreJ family protein [Vannielia sp.]|uniref:HupE/UreJ family protein n=1 Tax=Vannielia sp. TaxID=2813045 RepID=UPI0026222E2F|nr:HupE/UreJ family protein [Vannielia sp.]MDF1874060.1 HupE/UreJ family protein [Vannielia sp.]
MTKLLTLALKVTLAVLLSTRLASAHELNPAVADVTVAPEAVQMEVTFTAEAMIAGLDRSENINTDDMENGGEYTRLRLLSGEEMSQAFREAWPALADGFNISTDGQRVPLELTDITITEDPDPGLPRTTRITLLGTLPPGDAPVTIGWSGSYGPLVLRQVGGGADAYSDFLNPGATSEPLPRNGEIVTEGWLPLFARYIVVGFEHILPLGLDHILFVLGLFFFSLHLRPLLYQVTAFTLAHTVTLAMASLGIVTISPAIVEPLIAASIVYVAVENIMGAKLGWHRIAIVTVFGLLHGLGFASVLGEVGLEPSRFITGLIGFNVGVEIGQLTIISAALILIYAATAAARHAKLPPEEAPAEVMQVLYRSVSLAGSIVIALIGAYWVIERTLL